MEDMLKSFLFFFLYQRSKRKFFLFDIKIYKFGFRRSLIFVFYYRQNNKKRQKSAAISKDNFTLKKKIKLRTMRLKLINFKSKLKTQKQKNVSNIWGKSFKRKKSYL